MGLNNDRGGLKDNLIKPEVFDILKKDSNLSKIKESLKNILENEDYFKIDKNVSDWNEELLQIENHLTFLLPYNQKSEDKSLDGDIIIKENMDKDSDQEDSILSEIISESDSDKEEEKDEIYPKNIIDQEKPSDSLVLMEVDFNEIQSRKKNFNYQEKSYKKKVLVTNNKFQEKISDFL